jgi:hypothetical protein
MAAALSLVFAGAGCGRQSVVPVVVPETVPTVQEPIDATGVDAATEELIDIAVDEEALINDETNDADELGDDREALNDITESSYELR